MKRHTIILIGTATAAVGAIGLAGAVSARTGDDAERPITGAALTQASDAALEHLGEGTVTETEEGDEDSYYEVEVTLESGRQVDVQLDENFDVVGSSPDDESEADDG